jgi:hypothetical protein
MKQTLKRIIRTVNSVKGNSLAEFATTTALMATLAATAAPKLSEMSEGAKAEKSRNELDKMVKQAGQFYQDTADIEGRGRFPGQDKYDMPVTGTSHANSSATDHEAAILADLVTNGGSFVDYRGADGSDWVSVFGKENADFPMPAGAGAGSGLAADDEAGDCTDCPGVGTDYPSIHGLQTTKDGHYEWKQLFGGEVVGSQYQDGHFVYQVVKGGGTGDDAYPPVLYVADIENATHFNNVLEP